ncbi:type II secretion system protein GspK [Bilophila wadsworthia]|uniref:type II secretion system protein GspK n=1 Tax=Bilophila wadsworthia TaxID=35833 RepID=UPI00242EC8F1|nr:type II secretion system protein GspK [Bilophila wadsworthia]
MRKREGVVRPARVTVHAHEPGQQPGEDVGECLGTGTIGLAFVENGVDGKAAVFVLDGARKVRARQFGGKPFQPEAEQSPILPHVIRGSRFAVPGEDSRAEAFADILTRLLAGLMRVHGYAGGPDNALALAKEYVDSLRQWGGQTETDQDTLKWYLTQTPRYLPPGRPLLAPEEILLVRWPHVEQEWGRDVLRGTKELPGLLETLTIWTQGPMNMNTLQPAVLSALVRDERQARPFVNAVLHYRDNPDNDLGENWYKDLLSAYDVPALPNGCLDVRSRWYRLNLTVRQGARKNTLTSVGWVTHEYVTWEYRAVH